MNRDRGFRLGFVFALCAVLTPSGNAEELRAGAAAVDVTPAQFPVSVNGGMTSRSASQVTTPVHARALVFASDEIRVAIVVVDSCMMSRSFLDEVKFLAASKTSIPADRILISATHTHTAPAAMSCLGTDADPTYVPYLRQKLVEVIVEAESRLQPAEVGYSSIDASHYTALRRWVRRPDRLAQDPFGNLTVRANMHAGANWDDVTGESGPEDPALSVLAVRSTMGKPLALLTNFSMHYFSGEAAISSDYFGRYCDILEKDIAGGDASGFVAMMSHGCSGDIWRKDYTQATPAEIQELDIQSYSEQLAALAFKAYEQIQFEGNVTLSMQEVRLPMRYRTPNLQTLEWAQRVVDGMKGERPQSQTEVYAREQLLLHDMQETEVVVQAVGIGETGIATTPTETYALTGLKIKHMSPFKNTMVFDLANGGDGYIPPPEQHDLGGYNTWPARSAGLERMAEPKIVEAAISLLESVSGKPRRVYVQSEGQGTRALLALRPTALYRLDEWAGPRAIDRSGNDNDAFVEDGVLFFLEGPHSDYFSSATEVNRSMFFAGGRLQARLPKLQGDYSISLWFWNGLPTDSRGVTGWLWSRGHDHGVGSRGEHLGISGTATVPGRICVQSNEDVAIGKTSLQRWMWHHVVYVRQGDRLRVYLNGNEEPEIEMESSADCVQNLSSLYLGGKSNSDFNFEGRLDEIGVFDRALSLEAIRTLFPAK